MNPSTGPQQEDFNSYLALLSERNMIKNINCQKWDETIIIVSIRRIVVRMSLMGSLKTDFIIARFIYERN